MQTRQLHAAFRGYPYHGSKKFAKMDGSRSWRGARVRNRCEKLRATSHYFLWSLMHVESILSHTFAKQFSVPSFSVPRDAFSVQSIESCNRFKCGESMIENWSRMDFFKWKNIEVRFRLQLWTGKSMQRSRIVSFKYIIVILGFSMTIIRNWRIVCFSNIALKICCSMQRHFHAKICHVLIE